MLQKNLYSKSTNDRKLDTMTLVTYLQQAGIFYGQAEFTGHLQAI